MKLIYRMMLVTAMLLAVCLPPRLAKAQVGDTLLVEWANPDGTVKVNALYNAIKGDTLPGGARKNENRVYKLQKGGFYWITERIENKGFHLRIVGETPGPTELENPAVIQMHPRPDGSVDGRIITGQSSVTLKNLWLTGRDYNGVQTYYQPIQMDASNSRFIFDNCVLEQTNFALIAFTGKNNDIFYTNCKFRNLIGQPSTQQWEGRGISIWADQDTVIVENCTFFNVGMTAFQLEGGAASYIRFNHNTIVNLGRNVHSGNWFREAYFTNCLIVNGFWHGEGRVDLSNPNRDPRATCAGLFSVGALPSQYGPEQGRRIVIAKMATWRDPKFYTFYADSIAKQYYINPATAQDFFNKYTDHMKILDTLWLANEPGLPTYPSDIIDDMIKNISDLRAGRTPAHPYFWKPTQYPTDVSWPLPENFTYTDAALKTAGTDGLPLGDLNWFPAAKANFEANKETYIKQIEDLAGPRVKLEVVGTYEAEAGALAGTAAIEKFQGFSYFQMDGGGFIEWKFNLPAAGQYDLNCWTHMRGNSMRGQRIIVNGVSIHDPKGWGEYIWDTNAGVHAGMPINEWTWTLITQANILEPGALTLRAGENTIRIESSWGWQNFAGWDIIDFNTRAVVLKLRAPDVTSYELVIPRGEGAKFTPQGFKSVQLGANGSISWTMSPAVDGKYRIQIFYQNPGSAQPVQIKIDGATVLSNFVLNSKPDSSGTNILSDAFSMSAGSHIVDLVGSNVNVDFVQLIKETVASVRNDRNKLPQGFALEQNYPNPFNPSTTINFAVGKLSHVELTVYNVLGQRVATLINEQMQPGVYRVTWDAANVPSGLYFYTMKADGHRFTRKMMVIK